jgi:hypothetical protein
VRSGQLPVCLCYRRRASARRAIAAVAGSWSVKSSGMRRVVTPPVPLVQSVPERAE